MSGLLVHYKNITNHLKLTRKWKRLSKLQIKHLFWPYPSRRSEVWRQPSYQKTREIMRWMTKTHFSPLNRVNFLFQCIHSISPVLYSCGFWQRAWSMLTTPGITKIKTYRLSVVFKAFGTQLLCICMHWLINGHWKSNDTYQLMYR